MTLALDQLPVYYGSTTQYIARAREEKTKARKRKKRRKRTSEKIGSCSTQITHYYYAVEPRRAVPFQRVISHATYIYRVHGYPLCPFSRSWRQQRYAVCSTLARSRNRSSSTSKWNPKSLTVEPRDDQCVRMYYAVQESERKMRVCFAPSYSASHYRAPGGFETRPKNCCRQVNRDPGTVRIRVHRSLRVAPGI